MIGIRHGATDYPSGHAITKQLGMRWRWPRLQPRPVRAGGGCLPVDIEKGPRGPSENGNALHERNGLSSHGLHRSTFGDGELNCRVRHGTG